jgi:hypothetical protein
MYCRQYPTVLRKNAMSLKPYQDPVGGGGTKLRGSHNFESFAAKGMKILVLWDDVE